MPKKEGTLANELLFSLYAAGEQLVSTFLSPPSQWRSKGLYGADFNSRRQVLYNLRRRGRVEVVKKKNLEFLRLTQKGALEVLLAKAKLPLQGKWDRNWRMLIFDIPETAKSQRDKLRDLLKRNNFYRLQASVYINPYPLNREAVKYLQETGLDEYIRLIKVKEMDKDSDLKKKFNLK